MIYYINTRKKGDEDAKPKIVPIAEVSEAKEDEIKGVIADLNSSLLSSSLSSSSTAKIDQKDKQNNIFYCSKGDHIGYRYEILEELGKGAFGRVLKAFDHKDKEEIALKILKAED